MIHICSHIMFLELGWWLPLTLLKNFLLRLNFESSYIHTFYFLCFIWSILCCFMSYVFANRHPNFRFQVRWKPECRADKSSEAQYSFLLATLVSPSFNTYVSKGGKFTSFSYLSFWILSLIHRSHSLFEPKLFNRMIIRMKHCHLRQWSLCYRWSK